MNAKGASFYSTWEWKRARYAALVEHGAVCMLCGATPADDRIVVDHIKPVALYPQLALDPDNLSILCNSCNLGKGRSEDDHRPIEYFPEGAIAHMRSISSE
jgi:5-methylcytosine-specific restriction endonuclease McrA